MLSPTKQMVFRVQSEVCKILSNPKRHQILDELRSGEKTVSELSTATELRQATVSQHLALMRLRKIVKERRDGNLVYYRIADKRINNACDIMKAVVIDQITADSELAALAVAPIQRRRR